ncbi:protein-associating with the carboxyl-terminal domain of ezrin isoform X2 [Emydura macquarii macquarii]|uniref:protein-associating with the carboxyl-terminal domain of ezrin isoform X2 n=1 Tax=Emydura macquarii macquarii TaxID=1129001 RepID=UPI003529EA2A
MGSENSALKSCTLEEPPYILPTGLTIYPAVLQDGKLASVFVYKTENEDTVNKAAKHLKTLRHPCLLRFLSCTVETDGIHLVTERVKPLEMALKMLSSDEICAGIYDLLLALIFLHDRGNLTHNNVCLSSVFVSEDGHWKLGGMETVCKLNDATPEFLHSIKSVRDQAAIPPEEMSADFKILPESHGHARDAYSFGTMVENLLMVLNDQVSAANLSSFQHTLHCTLLNPDPTCRPPLSSLLSHEFFRNDFLEVVNFLKSLTLKTEEEKTEFFKFLLDRVASLSEKLIASRLVPLLINQLVFAEPVAVKSFLPHLLGPKKDKIGESQTTCLLSPAIFQTHVTPVLLKLFEVHEEHVRTVLLSHMDAYAELFTQEQLKNIILPQVLLGLRDTSDSIVAITLHGLAVLVSLLGPEVVVGGGRTKIFKCSAPSFSKTTDLSPADSPTHILSNQRSQLSQPVQNNFSGVFPKCPISGNMSLSSEKHAPRKDSQVALKTDEQDPQLSLNGDDHAGMKIVGSSRSSLHASEKPAEEWPDWSESEETENIQLRPVELCSKADVADSSVDKEPQDNFESSSPSPNLFSGNSLSATGAEGIRVQGPLPGALQLAKESESFKPSLPSVSSPANCWSNDSCDHPEQLGETACQERPPKSGLGEEFTIQVKRKPGQEPELDWFADMIPDIKPAAAFLILPEVRTDSMVLSHLRGVSSGEDTSPIVQFSSKFAAAEVTEAEAAGWGEEDELNWEDTNW